LRLPYKDFVGRTTELEELRTWLTPPSECDRPALPRPSINRTAHQLNATYPLTLATPASKTELEKRASVNAEHQLAEYRTAERRRFVKMVCQALSLSPNSFLFNVTDFRRRSILKQTLGKLVINSAC